MTAQTELFPAQDADRAQAVLTYLLGQREKAEKALASAEQKLADICELIDKQKRVLTMLRDRSVAQVAGEADDVPGVDPLTGEVAQMAEDAEVGYVGYIDPEGMTRESEVGPQTRVGELIADYLTAIGDSETEISDLRVLLCQANGGELPVDERTLIPQELWGKAMYRLERREREETEQPWEYEGPEPAAAENAA